MPNTLVHIGLQGLAVRSLVPGANLCWALLGCVIPDIPWILRRAAEGLSAADPYDLRLYAIVQSSLAFCLLAGLLFAAVSRRPLPTFGILALGSLLHLLLDALQTKWGNGVLLFAPFRWDLLGFDLFWPESTAVYLLTGAGFVYLSFQWAKRRVRAPDLVFRPAALFPLLAAYLLLPVVFLQQAQNADSHFVQTLRDRENRPGKAVSLDRAAVAAGGDAIRVRTFAGEEIRVEGLPSPPEATVSLQGVFVAEDRIAVVRHHRHAPIFRDAASMAGLVLVAIHWMVALRRGGLLGKGSRREAPTADGTGSEVGTPMSDV